MDLSSSLKMMLLPAGVSRVATFLSSVELEAQTGPALVELFVVVVGTLQGPPGAAVEHAENDAVARIVVEKADHHLVADFRAEEEAAVVAGVEANHPRPDAVVAAVDQREDGCAPGVRRQDPRCW